MPKAAKSFVIGNRFVQAGEDFEIPPGDEAEFRDSGLIEGQPAPAAPPPAPVTEAAEESDAAGKRPVRK